MPGGEHRPEQQGNVQGGGRGVGHPYPPGRPGRHGDGQVPGLPDPAALSGKKVFVATATKTPVSDDTWGATVRHEWGTRRRASRELHPAGVLTLRRRQAVSGICDVTDGEADYSNPDWRTRHLDLGR